jgi:hypothetical protein
MAGPVSADTHIQTGELSWLRGSRCSPSTEIAKERVEELTVPIRAAQVVSDILATVGGRDL